MSARPAPSELLARAQAGGDRLSPTAARRVERADIVDLGPISCWEIAVLITTGRVALDRPESAWVDDLLAPARSSSPS